MQDKIDATKNPDYDPEAGQKAVERSGKASDASKNLFNTRQPLYWAWGITLCVVLAFGFHMSYKLSQIATRLERIDTTTTRLNLTAINYSISRFKYRTVAPDDTAFETQMDNYGSSGWEAVSARRAASGTGYPQRYKYEIIMKKRY